MNINDYKNQIIEAQKTKDIKNALSLTEIALLEYPTDPFLLRTLPFLLYRLNRIEEAKDWSQRHFERIKNSDFFLKTYLLILEKDSTKEDFLDFVNKHLKNSNFDSIDFYIECSEIIYRKLGIESAVDFLLYYSNKFNDDKKILNKIDFFKNKSDVINYSSIKEKIKDKPIAVAIEEIEDLLVLPKYSNDIEILSYLAELYKKNNDYERAILSYKKSLTIKDNEFTRKMLGYLYYKIKDYNNAQFILKNF